MKIKLLSIIGAVLALASVSQAQTTNIFNSTIQYFTAFNTNFDGTFRDHRVKFWAGMVSLQGNQTVPLASTLGLSYDVFKPVNTNSMTHLSLAIESETLDGGVAGTLVAQEFGAAVNLTVHDVQLSGFAHGVYNFQPEKIGAKYSANIGFRVQKALTLNTYGYTGISVNVPENEKRIEGGVGVVF